MQKRPLGAAAPVLDGKLRALRQPYKYGTDATWYLVPDAAALHRMCADTTGYVDRFYLHWTGLGYEARLPQYHLCIDQYGRVWASGMNFNMPRRHIAPLKGHAIGAIAIALQCGQGALPTKQGMSFGQAPPTPAQVRTAALLIAQLAREFALAITPDTVLTHAEVATEEGYGPEHGDTDERGLDLWFVPVLALGMQVFLGQGKTGAQEDPDMMQALQRSGKPYRCLYVDLRQPQDMAAPTSGLQLGTLTLAVEGGAYMRLLAQREQNRLAQRLGAPPPPPHRFTPRGPLLRVPRHGGPKFPKTKEECDDRIAVTS